MDEAEIFAPAVEVARGERVVSARDIEQAGGLAATDILEMYRAFGFALHDPEEAAFTREEADTLTALGRLESIWPRDLRLQAARVYGQSLARIAETEAELFRFYTQRWILESEEDSPRALELVREAFERLLPLADPLLRAVHGRWVEYQLSQLAARTAEHARDDDERLPGAEQTTFLFCDLKDFTAFADLRGDAAAAEVIARFAEVIDDARGDDGRVVKGLGDGYFMVYPGPLSAVDAVLRIRERMRELRGPGIHAGVHEGIAVRREGDYFGRDVNLTARLLTLAGRNVVLATDGVVAATSERYAWSTGTARRVRGVRRPIRVHRLVGKRPPRTRA